MVYKDKYIIQNNSVINSIVNLCHWPAICFFKFFHDMKFLKTIHKVASESEVTKSAINLNKVVASIIRQSESRNILLIANG